MKLIEKIAFYKKNGKLSQKIKSALKYKFSSFLISFPFAFYFGKRPGENKIYFENYKFYFVLKKRFSRVLKKLPIYEENNEQNAKIIWWCWLQGEENAPNLCKACLASLRKNLPDFKINIVTEKNMWNLITVPDFIRKKYERGIISKTHFSDILRTCLLCEYGGVWIDSTVCCTGYKADIFSENLFYFSNIMRGDDGIAFSSWLISAHKNEPVLLTIRDLLFYYWKKHNHLYHYFLYHFLATMVLEKYPEIAKKVPVFSNVPPHIMQRELFSEYSEKRFKQYETISDFHKLTYKFLPSQNKNGTLYEFLISENNFAEKDGEKERRKN